jgi:hypothetical protein
MPDAELMKVLEQPEEICDPENQNDDHQAVQNRFDLALHGNEPVYKPQQNACCDNRDEDGGKRHFIFSSRLSGSMPGGHLRRGCERSARWARERSKKGESMLRSILILPIRWENS